MSTRELILLIASRSGSGRTGDDADELLPHIIHLIEHAPGIPATNTSGIVREEHVAWLGKLTMAWEGAVATHPNDVDVLLNAAAFFSEWDHVRGTQLARRALSVRPQDLELRRTLGLHVLFGAEVGDASCSFVEAAVLLDPDVPDGAAPSISFGAASLARLLAGAEARAVELAHAATRNQEEHWWGNDDHFLLTALGLIALRSARRSDAVRYLRDSQVERLIGAPSLLLAQGLLELGERGAVAEFLSWVPRASEAYGPRALRLLEMIRHGQHARLRL